VRLEEPSWWYREGSSTFATLLHPLGTVYGWAATARFARTKPYRSRLPVICIGNFTAGGTGKTPLAIHLCEGLKAAGHEPVALTRGYGGRLKGPYWVGKTDGAREVGDEALLLARAARTHLARNRRAGAHAIESGPHPVTVIVMDDGLQNPSLAKDLTLAVVDGDRGVGNNCVIPAGPLRAPLNFQLELTDAIIVNTASLEEPTPIAETFRRVFGGPVLCAAIVPSGDTRWLEDGPVLAWAGIGAPARFFALLERLRADVVGRIPFADHYCLTDADARRLLDAAEAAKAKLVTTEKDMARLTGAGGLLAELASRSRALPVKLFFADADAERLATLVATALQAR
jgi:tetraacyldisaccharide 4'-kinase